MYLGLKLHFTTDYDYTRYGGQNIASKHRFSKEKIEVFSLELQRSMMTKHWIIMFANFIKSPKGWLGDFKEEHYLEWSKNKQSLTYNFIKDMGFLFTVVDNFDSIFSCQNGQHSVLLKNFLAKRISVETMVILQGLLNYIGRWDKELKDDLVWI